MRVCCEGSGRREESHAKLKCEYPVAAVVLRPFFRIGDYGQCQLKPATPSGSRARPRLALHSEMEDGGFARPSVRSLRGVLLCGEFRLLACRPWYCRHSQFCHVRVNLPRSRAPHTRAVRPQQRCISHCDRIAYAAERSCVSIGPYDSSCELSRFHQRSGRVGRAWDVDVGPIGGAIVHSSALEMGLSKLPIASASTAC
jgi:hypothetical protein